MFRKILVANRGDPAIRIAKTLEAMDIIPAMVYTKDDKNCLHVQEMAGKRRQHRQISSYSNMKELARVARECGADALHPGWGFASEDPQFPLECLKNGITFIGPSHEVMEQTGSKEVAKAIAVELGIPVIRGKNSVRRRSRSRKQELRRWAEEIGLSDGEDSTPIMLKADAGAGGTGNQVVRELSAFDSTWDNLVERSRKYWRNPEVFAEEYIAAGRHIEVQCARDGKGNFVHFGTRDCSVQYRHQKMVEIAPAPNLSVEQESLLYQNAKMLFEKLEYCGVGTVEFYVVSEGRDEYFIEINPRIQVEHGITEMIVDPTIDLVELSIRIAYGENLSFVQKDISFPRCAIEMRINTQTSHPEDLTVLVPAAGKVEVLEFPERDYVRVDHALYPGYEVGINYNPTQAKLLICADKFERLMRRAARMLNETHITGIETNLDLLRHIIADPRFHSGHYDARFLGVLLREMKSKKEKENGGNGHDKEVAAAVGVAMALALRNQAVPKEPNYSHWGYTGRREAVVPFVRRR